MKINLGMPLTLVTVALSLTLSAFANDSTIETTDDCAKLLNKFYFQAVYIGITGTLDGIHLEKLHDKSLSEADRNELVKELYKRHDLSVERLDEKEKTEDLLIKTCFNPNKIKGID